MREVDLPMELTSVIGSERVDFSVEAKRTQPVFKSLSLVYFALVWTAFIGFMAVPTLRPLIGGRVVPSREDPLVPVLFIGIFTLIGLLLLAAGLSALFRKGGYFAGTQSRLIHYRRNRITEYQWGQFSGFMELDAGKGDLTLQLRTGKWMKKGKGRQEEYVPDQVYISGIPDVMAIADSCRKRIREHEPVLQNKA